MRKSVDLGGLRIIKNDQITSIDLLWLALLGVGQQGVGLILFTRAARMLSAASMGLIVLLEPVLGSLWAWLGTAERPAATTLAGGGVVIAAVLVKQWADRSATGNDPLATP
jgi:drug/metabolite transporter (DMT)-like permease